MSIIIPPRRTRTNPPKAPAPVAIISPPPRQRGALGSNIPNHKPMPFKGVAHNGYKGPGRADPRFAPLVIVMNPDWAKKMPEYIDERLRLAIQWKVGDPVEPLPGAKKHHMPIYLAPSYLTERALRRYLHVALLSDEVYDALELAIHERFDELNDPQGKIMSIVDDEIVVDYTKGVGPFYLDHLPAIEIHYAHMLRPVQPGAH